MIMDTTEREDKGFYVIYNGVPVSVKRRSDGAGYTAFVNNRILGDATSFDVALDCACDYVESRYQQQK